MALVPCPECKTQISDQAKACPKCGYPMDPKPSKGSAKTPPLPRLRTIPKDTKPPDLLPPLAKPIRPYMAYAGFLDRLFAYLVDEFLFITAIIIVLSIFIVLFGGNAGTFSVEMYGIWLKSFLGMNDEDSASPALKLIGRTLGFVLRLLYYACFESSDWQATPGKRLLKLKVMDEAGDQISFGLAVWRYLLKYLSALILGIGYLMILFTEKSQGLHDKIAGTVICLDPSRRQDGPGRGQGPTDDIYERKEGGVGPLRYTP